MNILVNHLGKLFSQQESYYKTNHIPDDYKNRELLEQSNSKCLEENWWTHQPELPLLMHIPVAAEVCCCKPNNGKQLSYIPVNF